MVGKLGHLAETHGTNLMSFLDHQKANEIYTQNYYNIFVALYCFLFCFFRYIKTNELI